MGSSSSLSSVVVTWLLLVGVTCPRVVVGAGGSSDLAAKCGAEFTKVTACLEYATGKADTPTKGCCEAVAGIRGKDPACLCFFIQQTHNGSAQIKSLGILESRLLQLPSACNIKNASISECPSLLGIPPNSPDYAIFNSSSTATPAAPTGTSSPDNASSGSGAARRGPDIPTSLLIVAAVFLGAFSIGSEFLGAS